MQLQSVHVIFNRFEQLIYYIYYITLGNEDILLYYQGNEELKGRCKGLGIYIYNYKPVGNSLEIQIVAIFHSWKNICIFSSIFKKHKTRTAHIFVY